MHQLSFMLMVYPDLVVQAVHQNLEEILQVVQLKKQLAQVVVEILVSVQILALELRVQVLQIQLQILQSLTVPVELVVQREAHQAQQVQTVQLELSLVQAETVAQVHCQVLQVMQVRVLTVS
jgi:hypothetical protein